MSPTPRRPTSGPRRGPAQAVPAPPGSAASAPVPDDRFFRHVVSSMRNGVIAIHRDGTIALMNDEAYRIFSLARSENDLGRPFSEVFRERPDVVRVLLGSFEM